MALRVEDLDRAVEFAAGVLGLREQQRVGGTSYLTCNDRHHELILIEGGGRSYYHIGLEVADGTALRRAGAILASAGMQLLDMDDSEPGIERALHCIGPGGHRFKLFAPAGRKTTPPVPLPAVAGMPS